MEKLYARQAAVALIVLGVLAAVIVQCTRPSGYVNCVVVEDEVAFIGERLKNVGAKLHKTLQTDECVALDRRYDNADGAANGRVRWAECMSGPDCDEAGMF